MSCPDCFSGHIHQGSTRGRVETVHGLPAYVTEPAGDGPTSVMLGIIVIIPDAFGWEFINNRLLADHYAEKGPFRVYLPDFMNGNAVPLHMIDDFKTLYNGGILSKVAVMPKIIGGGVPFMYRNRPSRTYPRVRSFFAALRTDPATAALPLGAAGFCWGGKHAVLLAGDEEKVAIPAVAASSTGGGGSSSSSSSSKRLLDAAFVGHPSALSIPADVVKIRIPVAFAVGDKDGQMSTQQAEELRKIVEGLPDESRGEVRIYEGCGHGFCVRVDPAGGDVSKQAEQAEDHCIGWMKEKMGIVA